MNEAFGLTLPEFLENGGYPAYPAFKSDPDRWRKYFRNSIIDTVIEKDILKFEQVKSQALFKQCFEIVCHYPGQTLSYQKMLGQLQSSGNVELVKRYFSLFEAAFLLRQVYKWTGSPITRIKSSPKLVPLAPAMGSLIGDAATGRVFEAAVGTELIRADLPTYYWQEGSLEVDYVVKLGRELIAVEVKSGRSKHAKSLGEIRKKYPKIKTVLVSPENFLDFCRAPKSFLEAYAF